VTYTPGGNPINYNREAMLKAQDRITELEARIDRAMGLPHPDCLHASDDPCDCHVVAIRAALTGEGES